MLTTLKRELNDLTEGDSIEAIIFGPVGWDSSEEENKKWPNLPKGKLLTPAQAKPWLDIEFDTGYGSPKCPAMYAWTGRHVYFIVQYDGSTTLYRIPRDPHADMPTMPGG
jgi:hypothetical protein